MKFPQIKISRVIHFITGFGTIFFLASVFGLIWLRYPDNHGAGPVQFSWNFGFLFLLSLLEWKLSKKLPLLIIILELSGLATTWVVDRRNIMIHYDEWIRRGMPEWGSNNSEK
jgi:hypothetical protein